MKECMNCKAKNRTTDIYCRNCGYHIQSNGHYILINTIIVFLIIGIIGIIALFISSYMIYNTK